MTDMTATGLPVFDETLQLSNLWLKQIMERLGWENRQRAYRALRATLHAVRDRLPPALAAKLAAQLPMLLRGLYFEGWHPSDKPLKIRNKQEFVDLIEGHFPTDPNPNPEDVVRADLAVIAAHVTAGEIDDVMSAFPEPIRALWPRRQAA
jgi:uncharacterized protein (DUF2267 family)